MLKTTHELKDGRVIVIETVEDLVNLPKEDLAEVKEQLELWSKLLKDDIKFVNPDNKTLIGYKLSGYVSKEIADIVLSKKESLHDNDLYFIRGHIAGWYVQRAKQLGILETWFTPVYE